MPAGYALPAHHRANGWRHDPDRGVRYKEAPDGRVLKTWELIKENGLHT